MKQIFLLLLFISVLTSCKKDKEAPRPSNEVKFKAVLLGGNEVPSTPSSATGEANAVLN